MIDADTCYRALLARDPRFDGLFFVGISTTGVYCRSVCPARTARRRSCTFFASAAAAEAEGYRPCLRCRPELAPGAPGYNGCSAQTAAIVARLQSGALNGRRSVADLAASVGMSDRQLRRVVKDATGATPVQIAQTARLLMAKRLLTDTEIPVSRVATAAGFSSLRRFNESFVAAYRLSPRRFRRKTADRDDDATLALALTYRPPYDWPAMRDFLAHRAIRGVEHVRPDAYLRTVALGGEHGWLAATFDPPHRRVRLETSPELLPVLPELISRVAALLDLSARPEIIDEALGRSEVLARSVRARPGVRVPGAFEGFELAWRAILGQQVSVRGATTLAGRFAERFGAPVQAPCPELVRLTPCPEAVASASPDEIAAIGIPLARAGSIHGLATLCAARPRLLAAHAPVEDAVAALVAIPGIGSWTAQYIAMRALHWPDAWPATDLGVRTALRRAGVRDPAAAAETWRPWRAYAAMRLWTPLEDEP